MSDHLLLLRLMSEQADDTPAGAMLREQQGNDNLESLVRWMRILGEGKPYAIVTHPSEPQNALETQGWYAADPSRYAEQVSSQQELILMRTTPQHYQDFHRQVKAGDITVVKTLFLRYNFNVSGGAKEDNETRFVLASTSASGTIDFADIQARFGLSSNQRKRMRIATAQDLAERLQAGGLPAEPGMISPLLIPTGDDSFQGLYLDPSTFEKASERDGPLLDLALSKQHSLLIRGEDYLTALALNPDYQGKIKPSPRELLGK